MKGRGAVRGTLLSLAFALAAGPAAPGDWPQFRGTARDGRVTDAHLPLDGDPSLRVVWSHPLGPGYSAVTVAEGRALTLYTDGTRESLVAFDAADGAMLWGYAIGAATRNHNGNPSKLPASTPLVHRGVVYGLGAHGKLFALRLSDGHEIWARSVEGRKPVHGFTASPLLVGNALVVAGGGTDGRAVTAYDRRDGKPLWSHGSNKVAYQSPLVVRLSGRSVLLVPCNDMLLGLDPQTGEPLFRHRHDADDGDGFAVPVAVPLRGVAGAGSNETGVLLTHRDRAVLYRVRHRRSGWRLEALWRSTALRDSYAAPVVVDGFLYGFGGESLRCVEVTTGREVWQERLRGGRGVIALGERLVVFAPGGSVVIADASPGGYRERGRLFVSMAGSYTWPSYADGLIYVRDHTRIAAVGIGSSLRAAGNALTEPDR